MAKPNNIIKISAETRRSIYNMIMSHADFMGVFQGGNYEDQNIVDFLKMIWDLPAMPSADPRFKNAEADAIQHLVNNDDWDLTYTFERRFNLLAGDIKYFIKFVEVCVSPFVRSSSDEIMQYVKEINPLLNRDNCELAIEDYIDERPHFLIKSGTGFSFERKDINSNRFTIYVDKLEDNKPCFFLESIIWDDYGHKTSFKLHYIDQDGKNLSVGKVKICKKNENKTLDVIPMSFLSLDSNYCSLGQDKSYYSNLKIILGEDAMAFLYAMRDAAAFSRISDDFENDLERLIAATDEFECLFHSISSSNKMSENDGMEITVCGNDDRILLIARYDNLGKGASGAAVQCLNVKMGIDPKFQLNI